MVSLNVGSSKAEHAIMFVNRGPGSFHSIEQLFESIAKALPGDFRSVTRFAPHGGANVRALVSNLRWLSTLKGADLFHITGDIHYALLGLCGRSTVLTIHDIRFVEEARGLKCLLLWLLWIAIPCMLASRITVISHFTKERLRRVWPFGNAHVRVIPNCVDREFTPTARRTPPSKPRLLHVGTTPNKNLPRIVDACEGISLELIVLGKLTPAQRRLIEEKRISYEAFDNLSRSEVVQLYRSCDFVLFVSTYEGFGMPILEAQAIGRPVLTSNLSPMKEVAGSDSLLVDPFNTEAIREAILQMLHDEMLCDRVVEAGLRNVAKYSAASVANQYAQLYREVLNN